MPGAPNRPPEIEGPAAPAPPTTTSEAGRRVLRRLAPFRVALRLDLWKGAPSRELVDPLVRAEAAYLVGDFVKASGDLDALSVRFAEPRWPTLPEPFKSLRVAIPAPMPPHWNPDNALPAPEKEAKLVRKDAEFQVQLAQATAAWATAHQIDLSDAAGHAERARGALAADGPTEAFWAEIEAIWGCVRERVPMPTASGRAHPPARRDLVRRRARRSGAPIDPDELAGYLEGVRHRVAEASPDRRPSWQRQLRAAEAAFARGDRAEAEERLAALDDQMVGEEPELSEFPRDLVGYLPVGEIGGPRPEEEDPLPNRLSLLGRLAMVEQSRGRDVGAVLARLTEAHRALSAGDRAGARRIADEVLTELERTGPPAGAEP